MSFSAVAKYFIKNVHTKRYLFQTGDKIKGPRGSEVGWLPSTGFEAPKCVGSDANYYHRAYWKLIPQDDDKYFIENLHTKRYLFQTGEKIKGPRGSEVGWLSSTGFEAPKCVGTDANYYNRAYWMMEPQEDGKYFIVNVETQRYLFQDGDEMKGERGSEDGWLEAPNCVGADANYYNRAYWRIIKT